MREIEKINQLDSKWFNHFRGSLFEERGEDLVREIEYLIDHINDIFSEETNQHDRNFVMEIFRELKKIDIEKLLTEVKEEYY